MTKKKSKMADKAADEFESWQPSRRVPTTPSPGIEHGRHDSPIRPLIQEDITPSPVDETKTSSDETESNTYEDIQNVENKSRLRTKNGRGKKGKCEDIPMEVLGQSPKFNSMQDESPMIFHRRMPSTDPSITLDSMGTMNISMYSNSSNTFTGTLKRGKKDQIVELQLTDAEINKLNRSTMSEAFENETSSNCSSQRGPHVLVLSVLYFPFAFLSSLVMNLYICTMCWYNIYLCLSEERTIWHKILFCPLLIIFFPVIIIIIPLGVAVYMAITQVSWCFMRWLREIKNFEKGFYGWLCQQLHVPECSPYEVIILNENGVVGILENSQPVTPV